MKILLFFTCLFKLILLKFSVGFHLCQKLCTSDLLWDVLEHIDTKMALLSSHYHLALNSKCPASPMGINVFCQVVELPISKLFFFFLTTAPFPQLL